MTIVNIKGLNKARLLVALYNRSKQQGMGLAQPLREITEQDAEKLIARHIYFDYLYGKIMKVDLNGDEMQTALFNRDNGDNAAEEVIKKLRGKK